MKVPHLCGIAFSYYIIWRFNLKNTNTENKQVKKADDFLTAVNQPSHYQDITIRGKNGQMTFEAIEIIDSVLEHLNFGPSVSHAIGDALKYILRCGKKDSDNNTTTDLKAKGKQDILKSSWYLKRAADMY